MQHQTLIDYQLATTQDGFVVRALVRLTGTAPARAARTPLNLSIVLDRSGSMAGAKLRAAREAAAFLVRRLHPEDTASVVAYDTRVQTVASPAAGADQADLPARIEAIDAGSSTNLSGGWLRGRELVGAGLRPGALNRVLLLTDGLANVGITEPDQLAGLCGAARAEGITTSTIGFGADYDEHLLRAMADAGGGNAWHIERADQAVGVFEEEIEGLLTLCAQNVSVEVVTGPAVRMVANHSDYPATPIPGGGRVELGDLYAREGKTLLFEFLVPGLAHADAVEIATLTVSGQVLTAGGGVEQETVRFTVRTPLDRAGHEEPEVRRQVLLVDAARAREEALRLLDSGDPSSAAVTLLRAADHLVAEPTIDPDEVRELREAASAIEDGAFDALDAKYHSSRSRNIRRGRVLYDRKLRRPPPDER